MRYILFIVYLLSINLAYSMTECKKLDNGVDSVLCMSDEHSESNVASVTTLHSPQNPSSNTRRFNNN